MLQHVFEGILFSSAFVDFIIFYAVVSWIKALQERDILLEGLIAAKEESEDLPDEGREASNDTQHQVYSLNSVLCLDFLGVKLELHLENWRIEPFKCCDASLIPASLLHVFDPKAISWC